LGTAEEFLKQCSQMLDNLKAHEPKTKFPKRKKNSNDACAIILINSSCAVSGSPSTSNVKEDLT
jgi:hypothetical protein